MKAKIKLKPTAARPVAIKPVEARAVRPLDRFGKRWCAGESIRLLATEAGMQWNELQAKLRAAGYLRSHRSVVIPK